MQFLLQTREQIFHDPGWNLRALARITKSKEHEVAEEHAPMGVEAVQEAWPVQALPTSTENMGNVGAVIAFPFFHERL